MPPTALITGLCLWRWPSFAVHRAALCQCGWEAWSLSGPVWWGVGGVSWKAGAAGVTDDQHRLHCLIFIWPASGLVITQEGGGEIWLDFC